MASKSIRCCCCDKAGTLVEGEPIPTVVGFPEWQAFIVDLAKREIRYCCASCTAIVRTAVISLSVVFGSDAPYVNLTEIFGQEARRTKG